MVMDEPSCKRGGKEFVDRGCPLRTKRFFREKSRRGTETVHDGGAKKFAEQQPRNRRPPNGVQRD